MEKLYEIVLKISVICVLLKGNMVSAIAGEACMQIYSVPKQTVRCDPSQETVDNIQDIRSILDEHKGVIDATTARIDSLDPDKPRELPEEVKERLNTIDGVKTTQAGHEEYLKRLETELEHLLERMKTLEASDRLEVARLIELQTKLIQTTLHQSNISVHDEYVRKLTDSTHDLTSRLQQLELDLKDAIVTAEHRLEADVQEKDRENKGAVKEVSTTLLKKLGILQESLNMESIKRLLYQNKTEANQHNVTKVQESLAALRNRVFNLEEQKEGLSSHVEDLQNTLDKTREEKALLQEKADHLQSLLHEKTEHLQTEIKEKTDNLQVILDELGSKFGEAQGKVFACEKRTHNLTRELAELRELVQQREHLLPRTLKVGDCQDALQFFQPASGVYTINPHAVEEPFDVYCDMNITSGWTVIQRRQDGNTDFYRNWQEYKHGFGDVNKEHWIGLKNIHALTSRKKYSLRVDMQDWDGHWWHAQYEHFHIDDDHQNYALHVSGFHGDAGDSLLFHDGMPFSTYDNNNDLNDGICAEVCHGGWWYKDCFHANLNGRYYNTGAYTAKLNWGDGVVWRHIHGTNFYSLKSVIMKIKPQDPIMNNKIDEM